MRAARSSQVKERRQAAFDLASMAANSDDDKFRIVAEGGCVAVLAFLLFFNVTTRCIIWFFFRLEVLIRLALAKDQGTQEHAVEAIAELVTIPAIQVLTLKLIL